MNKITFLLITLITTFAATNHSIVKAGDRVPRRAIAAARDRRQRDPVVKPAGVNLIAAGAAHVAPQNEANQQVAPENNDNGWIKPTLIGVGCAALVGAVAYIIHKKSKKTKKKPALQTQVNS